MRFHVVYRNVNGKVQPVAMDKPEHAPRVKLPSKAKVIVVDKQTGKVVENVVVSEVDGNIIVTAEQNGIREAVVIKDGQARGVMLLEGAPASEMAASIPFEVLAVESGSSAALYIGGGLAAAAGGGAVFAATSDKQAPTFLYGPKDQTITENSPAGSQVYVAQAADNKGKVAYSLKAGSDAGLTIDPVTGKVTLSGTADYETKASYTFTVVATDPSGNASEQTVTVNVTNVDERGPTITSASTAATVVENSGAGRVVYTAAATDTDFVAPATATSVTYSLKPGSDAGLSIDPVTGQVTLASNPDYETKSSYSFTVIAKDAAGNATEKTVTFNIGNVDEVAPTITSGSAATTIAENSAPGQVIYTATATDTDFVAPATATSVTYSLKPGSDAGLSIDPVTGKVTLVGSPDYETKSTYSFTVVARDAGGNAAEKAVTLNIGNVDERGPTITSASTAATIAENSGAGRAVYTAAGTDTDFNAPATASSITWSLKPAGDAAAFSINAQTGVVTLIGNPNYEAKSSYNFTVVATDAAGNATEKAVTFNISNADEVGPTITSSATAATIQENSGAGQVIYTAAATDSDFNAPATANSVTYSLKPGSDAGLSIDPQTGRVTLAGNPDYETKSSYNFTVVATDAVGNATEKAVTLNIGDVVEDAMSPTVSSVALTADNESTYATLNAGDKVTITVTMDENTVVNTAGGTPRIALNIGGTTVYANYAGGSGTQQLTFEYTILDGQNDGNGISIASNSIEANGGTLRDAVGNSANLTHSAVTDNASYKVDTVDPVAAINTQPAQPETVNFAKFEATGFTTGDDTASNLLLLNPAGDFVLTWQGTLADGTTAIFVQKCQADGTRVGEAVRLDGSETARLDVSASPYALGTSGKYAVAWVGFTGSYPAVSVFVQIFNSDGTKSGNALKFDSPLAASDLLDSVAKITPLNDNGDFVVSWVGFNSTVSPYANSVWVQKVGADGTLIGDAIALNGDPNNINGKPDFAPDVAAVGNDGSFIVTWYGSDATSLTSDYSIFAQKFGPDGQPSGQLRQLEVLAEDQISQEVNPRIALLGADGSYAITWSVASNDLSKNSVYVQKFAADGTAQGSLQRLDGVTDQAYVDYASTIAAVGAAGMYVVVWQGNNSSAAGFTDTSIYVQLFNSDGTRHGATAKLDADPAQPIADSGAQVIRLGENGEYAVAWTGNRAVDAAGGSATQDVSVYVQKFNADGSLNGAAQVFDASDGLPNGADYLGNLVTVGSNGDFLITWQGKDADGDYSVYVSKTVTTPGAQPVTLGSSNEAGSLYLVHSAETVTSEADILALAGDHFKAQTNAGANVGTALDKTGLADGSYKLYAVDHAGNLSAASADSVTVGGIPTGAQTVFVLGEGYPNLVDGGDGIFGGWNGSPGGDDILQNFTPGELGYVDFSNNAVDVKFLGIPADRPLDMTGFGEDDSIEIFLSDLPQAYYGNAPAAPTTWLNRVNFNNTTWNGMTMSGGPSHIYDGKVAMWLNRQPYAHLGVNFKTGPDGTHELRLVYNWQSSGPRVATSRLMAFWGNETNNMQVYFNTTVHWPDVAPPPPL